MNIRLVAYRPNIDGKEDTYNLDLQESPNISINFQFADITEPDKRKASYTQTFKLPFTDNNNEFFQNWFNVNLTTLVFSTREKFNASLFVGTVPQFEGFIQLKAVYQKAQLYEVVLMSNTADLFTNVGNTKLRDVFQNDDGSYSDELNHTFNETNIKASWDGDNSAFQNTSGVSLRDTAVDVQKVMYPISVTAPNFFYDGTNQFLSLSDTAISDVGNYIVPITQFRPAVQLKTLLKLIIAKAGFSYTSTFIDGAYFGKLFMTTCNQLTLPTSMAVPTAGASDGSMVVGNSSNIFKYELEGTFGDGYCITSSIPQFETWHPIEADTTTPSAGYTVPYDPYELWNNTNHYFTKQDFNMNSMEIKFVIGFQNIEPCWEGVPFAVEFESRYYNVEDGSESFHSYWVEEWTIGYYYDSYHLIETVLPLMDVEVGESIRVYARMTNWKKRTEGNDAIVELGASQCLPPDLGSYPQACSTDDYDSEILFGGMYNQLSVNWAGYSTNLYGQVIDVPACIDPGITQKAFLKDLIQRFNLVIVSDPNNSANLIIEPYNDYIGSGDIKHWTEKLDLSKEVIVKDTGSLQKEKVLFTDLEDVDLMNKSIKDNEPEYNVYGKVDIIETNNEFAKGEMKNEPIFSPYINQRIFQNSDDQLPTLISNMAVQYEYTYKKVEGGIENTLEATKPKMFYYSGVQTALQGENNYYLHSVNLSTLITSAHSFTTYPLCSPFELTTNDEGQSSITTSTKSLYWGQNPPVCGDLSVFNYIPESIILKNSLYFTYWTQYLNSIYGIHARIMECYLNLNEVDIFNFKFSDEIFIKDSYWRILNISNYQVGSKASTKVTLLKVEDTYDNNCTNCDYVVGGIQLSDTQGTLYLWCPSTDADCTPDITSSPPTGMYTSIECCDCINGTPLTFDPTLASQGLFPCVANTGSLPVQIQNIFSPRSIFSTNGTKSIISGKIGGLNMPLIRGNNNTKYSKALLPYAGDDIIIKYNSALKSKPQLDGESHKIILSGYTEGNTRGYAYARGNDKAPPLTIPVNTNMVIRVKGIVTVIGGTSSTYTLDTTEAFAYYTAFKSVGGTITQLSTAGGQQEFSIREGANPTTCTLYIFNTNNLLYFGLDDSQTDTKRIWQLSAEIDVNRIYNMQLGYGENWALYQNTRMIQLQDYNYLIWN